MLRQFRDSVLLTNGPGRWFVDQYYRYSPPAARWLDNHGGLKPIVQAALLPVVFIAWLSLHFGPFGAAVSMLVLLLTMSLLGHRLWAVRTRLGAWAKLSNEISR